MFIHYTFAILRTYKTFSSSHTFLSHFQFLRLLNATHTYYLSFAPINHFYCNFVKIIVFHLHRHHNHPLLSPFLSSIIIFIIIIHHLLLIIILSIINYYHRHHYLLIFFTSFVNIIHYHYHDLWFTFALVIHCFLLSLLASIIHHGYWSINIHFHHSMLKPACPPTLSFKQL